MQVFQLRALQVPPQKCQQKLLQATRSILSLLRERDYLLASLRWQQQHAQQTDRKTGNQPETQAQPENQTYKKIQNASNPSPHPSPSSPLPVTEPSLSTLHFSDSEVEGQKSLEQLMENCLSSSPPPDLPPPPPPPPPASGP